MPDPWAPLRALLRDAVAAGQPPGFGLSLWVRGGEQLLLEEGQAELRPCSRPVRPHQPYDLASLTKVLCTTPLALALVGRGLLDLDAPVTRWLPDAPVGVSARQLLDHSSGLPAGPRYIGRWRPRAWPGAAPPRGSGCTRRPGARPC